MDRIRISLLSECYAHDGNNLINIMTMKSGPRERLEPQKMGFQQIDDNLKFTLSPTITLRAWQLAWRHIYIYTMKVLVRRSFHTCSLYALEAEDQFVGSIVSFDSHIVILKITCKQFENRHSYYLVS